MTKQSTRSRGTLGEDYAVSRLRQDGYTILERNYRSGHHEIDIIAQKDDVIAFIEVKLRSVTGYLSPVESLRKAQKRRIVLSAVEYLSGLPLYNAGEVQPRFDFISIVTDKPGSHHIIEYDHFEGAFGTEDLDVFV